MSKLFDHLCSIEKVKPVYEKDWSDCSVGCSFWLSLEAVIDFGVCINPESVNCGLLIFEHVGCPKFEYDDGWDEQVGWDNMDQPFIPKRFRD